MIIHQQNFGNKISGIFEGLVVSCESLDQEDSYMPVKIWIQGLHAEELKNEPEKLPTAVAAAPIFGSCDGHSGLFSKPKPGTIVYCFAVGGDSNDIVYFAVDYEHNHAARAHSNSLPVYTDGFAVMRQGNSKIEMLSEADGRQSIKLSVGDTTVELNSNGEIIMTADKIFIRAKDGFSASGGNSSAVSIDKFGNLLIAAPGANAAVVAKSFSVNVIIYTKKFVHSITRRFKSLFDTAISMWTSTDNVDTKLL